MSKEIPTDIMEKSITFFNREVKKIIIEETSKFQTKLIVELAVILRKHHIHLIENTPIVSIVNDFEKVLNNITSKIFD